MKKITMLCMLFIIFAKPAFADKCNLNFESFSSGVQNEQYINKQLNSDLSWKNNVNIVEDNYGKYLHTDTEAFLIIPENSRRITVGAKMRTSAFDGVKFPLHFCGGSINDLSEVMDNGIFGPNWPAGLGLIPENSTSLKDPENILLSAGWGKTLNENDNDIYVYKNEWFYAKISYDYTDMTFRVYYSYDGNEYYEVYSEEMQPIENDVIRSVWFEKNMSYDDINIIYETDSVYDVYMIDGDSKIIDSITDETSFSIFGGLYNYNNNLTQNITTIVAVYDKTSSVLLEVKTDEAEVGTASDVCLGEFELEKNSDNVTIKFFAFESLENIIPCCQTKVLK